jgi:hypothetical protein
VARRGPNGGAAGGSIRVSGDRDLYALKKQCDAVSKNAAKELKKGLTEAAAPMRAKVAAAASWSTRIPRAVKVNTRFTAKTTSVAITVNQKQAPHARPLENDGRPGFFTHPVPVRAKGTRRGRLGQAARGQVVVKQKARPFFFDTITDEDRRMTRVAVEDVADGIEKQLGFK